MTDRAQSSGYFTRRFALYGALVGFLFPFLATLVEALSRGVGPLTAQAEQPLLWIIDTVPIVLGVAASLAGRREDALRQATAELEQSVQKRTDELARANNDLKAEVDVRERIASELREARNAAEAASRAKGEFLANMSHEIRTPMNGIIGMSDLLVETALDERQMEYAETIRSSGAALLRVIDDILDFSKIEAGKLEIEEHSFDAHALVEDAIELVSFKASRKGIGIISDIDPKVPRRLIGDSTRLRQILLNLVGNAVKFTSEGEVIARLRLDEQTVRSVDIVLEVIDSGIGIAQGHIERLFEKFSQVDASTTRRFGGTGLGLAISRRLVELMGGRLEVQSELGVGSTFRLILCLERAPVEPGDLDDTWMRRWSGVGAASDKQGPRVLIVEPSATVREMVARHIAAWGGHSVEATTIDDAVTSLKELVVKGAKLDAALVAEELVAPGATSRLTSSLGSARRIKLTSPGRDEETESEKKSWRAIGPAWIHLAKPIRISRLKAALIPEESSAAPIEREAPSRPTPSPTRNVRILVVEDNRVNQLVIVRLLEKVGYGCKVVGNGLEALEALGELDDPPHDIVLMDCQMPEMDGFTATAEIRKREAAFGDYAPRIPIIAMTAHAMKGDRERCIEAGMDDYLSKPVRAPELLAAVKRWAAQTPGASVSGSASVSGPASASTSRSLPRSG